MATAISKLTLLGSDFSAKGIARVQRPPGPGFHVLCNIPTWTILGLLITARCTMLQSFSSARK
jgi:hypothetical protein